MKEKSSKKQLLGGTIILAVGAMLLMRNFGIYEEFLNHYIFRWEMILIAIGTVSVITHEGRGPGFVLIIIGGGFMLKEADFLPDNMNFWQLFLAVIFITAGLFTIFRRKNGFNCDKKNAGNSYTGSDSIDDISIFGGGDRTIVTDNFSGGKLLAIFGGSNFDLTRSSLAPGVQVLDTFMVFGGFKLVIPEEWNVKVEIIPIFGGVSDKHRVRTPDTATQSNPVLVVKGFVIFGGGEIRSF